MVQRSRCGMGRRFGGPSEELRREYVFLTTFYNGRAGGGTWRKMWCLYLAETELSLTFVSRREAAVRQSPNGFGFALALHYLCAIARRQEAPRQCHMPDCRRSLHYAAP